MQAAAGMRLVPPERYAALRDMHPLLIVDEIATGFGRTGTMFAFEQLDLRPDLLCVGKVSPAACLRSRHARARTHLQAFLGAPEERKQFFHGHSFAGNPIACAAALASLELFEPRRRSSARAASKLRSGVVRRSSTSASGDSRDSSGRDDDSVSNCAMPHAVAGRKRALRARPIHAADRRGRAVRSAALVDRR